LVPHPTATCIGRLAPTGIAMAKSCLWRNEQIRGGPKAHAMTVSAVTDGRFGSTSSRSPNSSDQDANPYFPQALLQLKLGPDVSPRLLQVAEARPPSKRFAPIRRRSRCAGLYTVGSWSDPFWKPIPLYRYHTPFYARRLPTFN
jgi:hypothetical protein